MKRAVTVEQLLNKKFKEMPFKGKWHAAIGTPEKSGVWIIWGGSGNGKTSFAMQLAKYLTEFGKVAYDTLEEGARKSMQQVMIREQMIEVSKNFIILDRESVEELRERLSKRKSPSVIFIDSLQYTGMNYRDVIQLKEDYPTKLFIFISHAEGRQPQGRTASQVRYDADVKIRVEGYKAMVTSRYGGGRDYTIWQDGANKYWND